MRHRSSTDYPFTSSCSPPRVATTQLLSVTRREAPPVRDFHSLCMLTLKRTRATLSSARHSSPRQPTRTSQGNSAARWDTAALVRLRRQPDRAVQVRSCAVKNRAVSNRNCVAARRGGEQRNENDQSVTQEAPRGASAVNSIRSAWVDESAREGRSRSRRANPAGRRAIPGHPADGWRQNGRQSGCPNQGDPPVLGVVKDQQSAQPAGGSQSVRSSEEAGNDRGAKGTQEGGSNTNGKSETDRRECRKAGPRRSRPGVNNRRGDDHPNGWCLGTRRRAAPLSQETH